jgi:hypothetical protein
MDKDVLTAWIVLIIVWFVILCIFMTIGSLAKKRGRSFWNWTMIPFLIPLGIDLFFLQIQGTPLIAVFLPFLVTYVIGLISVLLSGKTKEKRMQEIYEEEQWRKSMRD